MKSKSFILPTPYEANDLSEFSNSVKQISIASLYHHIFEARIRLERGTNDFSDWLENELGETELGHAIDRLDPYTYTLEALRQKILRLIEKRLPQSAEEAKNASR